MPTTMAPMSENSLDPSIPWMQMDGIYHDVEGWMDACKRGTYALEGFGKKYDKI